LHKKKLKLTHTFRISEWIIGAFIIAPICSFGQRVGNDSTRKQVSVAKNLTIGTGDSAYSITFNVRMQNRLLMNTISEKNLNPQSWEARVRRLRLSMRGHILNERLTYRLQLSFSRGDMDWNATEESKQNVSPNAVRDAMIYYQINKNWNLGFGQSKLPGNRQRVISSGSLQFYDRSPVNASFTLDRDFGIFSDYLFTIGNSEIHWKSAISTGEGRNSSVSNKGLAYTSKLEVLVFGKFTDGGDYFEGDLVRETKPKLSLSAGYHFNDLAVRTIGQTGTDLASPRSYQVIFADVLFKYSGFAFASEFMKRNAIKSAITGDPLNPQFLVVGQGYNSQLSYCFPNLWEVAGRYSWVGPGSEIRNFLPENEQIGIGVSRYLMRHKVKAQFNVFHNTDTQQTEAGITTHKNWFGVFQMELGI
jgi:phosphate-selective porin OprO/OprP